MAASNSPATRVQLHRQSLLSACTHPAVQAASYVHTDGRRHQHKPSTPVVSGVNVTPGSPQLPLADVGTYQPSTCPSGLKRRPPTSTCLNQTKGTTGATTFGAINTVLLHYTYSSATYAKHSEYAEYTAYLSNAAWKSW
jgi:hypothetical protein